MKSRKTALITYLQSRKTDADVETGLVETVGRRRGNELRIALTYTHCRR